MFCTLNAAMNKALSRGAILVTFAVWAVSTLSAINLAELWVMPEDITARDLFYGVGGPDLAPKADVPYTWVATDNEGYSPGFDVRDSEGRRWSVKLGREAQPEVVASRVLWAIGYHQPPIYFVSSWQLSGGPGGRQPAARFRTNFEGWKVHGHWSWVDNPFKDTQPFRGLIVANVLLNNWDWKASNNRIYRDASGARRHVVRDLGASFGKTSPSKLLALFPMRGFGQGSRNNIDDFESQGFIRRVEENDVDFDFHTIHGPVVDLVRPSDVRWTADLLNRLTDAQWDAAFRAADYSPDVRARYIRKIKAKIAEGLAVS